MTDCFTWVDASLQQLKAQTGLVQVPRAQLEGHPVAEAGVALALHHAAALRLHHLSVNLQAHLDTHTCREHTCCVTAADAQGRPCSSRRPASGSVCRPRALRTTTERRCRAGL